MNIGYACLTVGVRETKLKTCTLKNISSDKLTYLIQSNLDSLDNIIEYNIRNDIKLFRISSDIIPFGSHKVNTLKWWEQFDNQLKEIGNKALTNGIRLSMHPGQYTVLNSKDEEVAGRAAEELQYHARFLDALGLGSESKIILHIGGAYGDKDAAIKRFIQKYQYLDENIRQRLVIENDDRNYNISEVLAIGESENIPVVFDNLHNQVNPDNSRSEAEWIAACRSTWKASDGPQKIHYSQQGVGKRPGSHSATIDVDEFLQFYNVLPNFDMDIMVEVKDKNLSAVKCINTVAHSKILRLEKEWERYKYLVLENSPQIYNEIRQLLKPKNTYPVLKFYKLIDEALRTSPSPGQAVNAAQHIWGYLSGLADEKTSQIFEKNIEKVYQGGSTVTLKRQIWTLVIKQQQEYLLDSLYFMNL